MHALLSIRPFSIRPVSDQQCCNLMNSVHRLGCVGSSSKLLSDFIIQSILDVSHTKLHRDPNANARSDVRVCIEKMKALRDQSFILRS